MATIGNYVFGRQIGRGAFSIVHECVHMETNQKFAIKSVDKKIITPIGWSHLRLEINILFELNHPNVLKMFEFFETESHVHLVLEYLDGGELFDRIVTQGRFEEKDASQIISQILEGVSYVHQNGIAHRDLKPENLLCSSDGKRIVIADFGLAKIFGRGQLLRTHCGTLSYAAPEVIQGDGVYSESVDMW